MKKAFTLLELLVVMGIVGLLGTVSVGGYHAMQRGMEERGVMENVNAFVRAAYHRAQIDRQPTAVYFWNETVRSRTTDEHEIVVGKAVAVRRYGRFSRVVGQNLIDEFADLDLTYETAEDGGGGGASAQRNVIYLYPMEKLSDIASGSQLRRSTVRARVEDESDTIVFANGQPPVMEGSDSDNTVPAWGFVVDDDGGVEWKAGMAYGLEFMQLELPRNFVFGSDYATSVDNPVRTAGTLVFDVGKNDGSGTASGAVEGRNAITVYSLRPDGVNLKAQKVASSDNPERSLR